MEGRGVNRQVNEAQTIPAVWLKVGVGAVVVAVVVSLLKVAIALPAVRPSKPLKQQQDQQ